MTYATSIVRDPVIDPPSEAETLTEEEDTSRPPEDGEIREPFDPNKIRVRPWAPTIYNLMERLKAGELDLSPDFQRRAGAWKEKQQGQLIESLLMRIPLPAFYLDELPLRPGEDTNRYAVVDGVQRLYAFDQFINRKSFSLEGMEFLRHLNGAGFDKLSAPLQRRILETQITVNVVDAGTPDEAKLQIFKRINTGGLPLNAQEIRHAMCPKATRDWLRRAASSETFAQAVGRSTAEKMALRMEDRECVARFVAFRDRGAERYRSAMDFDAFILGALKQLSTDDHDVLFARFERAMVAAHTCLGEHAFRKVGENKRGPVNKALFEATSVNLDLRTDAELELLASRPERVMAGYKTALADKEVSEAVSFATGDVRKVARRFGALKRVFDEALR